MSVMLKFFRSMCNCVGIDTMEWGLTPFYNIYPQSRRIYFGLTCNNILCIVMFTYSLGLELLYLAARLRMKSL